MYEISNEMEADQSELIALVQQMGADERDRHVNKMREILSDDLLFRRANGSIVTKTQYLEQLENPQNSYDYLESENIEASVNENAGQKTAVVSLLVVARGQKGDTSFAGVFHNVRLFVKEAEGWRCRVWLNTKVAESKILS